MREHVEPREEVTEIQEKVLEGGKKAMAILSPGDPLVGILIWLGGFGVRT